jgi:carbonic anhydrase/acetyltransferase-like protein (isoleucine patch superfamily)
VAPQVDPTAFVAEGAWVIGDVSVQRDASVWFNAVLRGDINRIEIGERTNIQDGAVVHVTGDLMAYIGPDVTVGHKAMVHACRIEQGCLIGMNAVVLDGAMVGPFSLVAAGSVVKEGFRVPEGSLAAGVPARVVRPLTGVEREEILRSAERYVHYARSFSV